MNSGTDLPILVVEDDSFQRRILCKLLSVLGFSTLLQAESAADALKQLTALRGKPHIVITDLEMPDTSGTSFLQQLAHSSAGSAVLIVSGKSESELRSAVAAGSKAGLTMLGSIAKPVTVASLQAMLESQHPA